MKKIAYLLPLIMLLAMLSGPVPTVSAQQKYALLISAGRTTVDDNSYHSEYWYDLFLMYRMLIEDGFTHNNIFVLYGNGNDFTSTHGNYQPATFFPGVGQITDYPVSQADVDNIFNWLAAGNAAEGIPQIQDDDFLYYWWMGHGSTQAGMPACDYEAFIETTGERVPDTDFQTYFARLPDCQLKALYVMTCHSGGLIDNLEGLHRMVHTATPCHLSAYSSLFDVWHADFSYHAANAFREQGPAGVAIASDSDGDGLVSCDETNDYAHANTTSSTTQIGDYRNIAPLTFIANAQPGTDVPRDGIYSRDYEEDNGTEPSEYMSYVWYHGPDLWVRNAQDGGTSNQDPEFGATNYVYSRIHNIDCMDMDVDVELSWCDASVWSHPASWNTIAAFTEGGLAKNESRIVHKPWTTVPVPGNYCLHTVLDAAGDAASADGRAFMDNNKVQINVTVVDLAFDWARNIRWNIENGIDEPVLVDLVLERLKILPNTAIELHIPPEIDFRRVIGGEAQRTKEGTVIIVSPRSRRLVVQDIKLKGAAKHPAILMARMPKNTKPDTTMQVKVSERMEGREMGGIVFDLKKVSKSRFMGRAFRDAHVFFAALAKQFDIDGADEMAALFKKASRAIISGDDESAAKALELFNDLVPRITKDLSDKLERSHLKRFDLEMNQAGKSLRSSDWESFTNRLESGMVATKVLFMKKSKI